MFPPWKEHGWRFFANVRFVFLRGSFAPYPSLGKLGNSSELKSFELGNGICDPSQEGKKINLKTSFKINKMSHLLLVVFAESLVEALTAQYERPLLRPGVPFWFQGCLFWWPDSRTKNRDLHSFFPIEGKTPNARTLQKSEDSHGTWTLLRCVSIDCLAFFLTGDGSDGPESRLQ